MPGKALSKKELKEYRKMLLARRALLLGDVEKLEGEALKTGSDSAGDLSTLPLHMADMGTDSNEQDITLGLMESENEELQEIEEALERIDDGTFGICDECDKVIPKTRLNAIPWALLCVTCKSKEEEGHISGE